MPSLNTADRTTLLQVLQQAFELPELEVLTFVLGVIDSGIRRATKQEFVLDLLRYLEQREKIGELLIYVIRERPSHCDLPKLQEMQARLITTSVLVTTSLMNTWIVDCMHRGDFATISKAISAARPGDKILVRPGHYDERLVINKPLEIVGDGEVGEVIVQTTGKSTLLFKSTVGIVRNLTLQNVSGKLLNWFCVDIPQGRLTLEACDLKSKNHACIGIHGHANPIIRKNHIHNGINGGVIVYQHGKGLIEENNINANRLAGICICGDGNPIVRNNSIHDGMTTGIFVYQRGQGLIEYNEIFRNGLAGIDISEDGNPIVRKNSIREGKDNGVLIHQQGRGIVEANDIFDNTLEGIQISKGGNPIVRKNRIHDGKSNGILVNQEGQGLIEDNYIFDNKFAGVAVKRGGKPMVRNNHIYKNSHAIWINESGKGTFIDNDLRDNEGGAWQISGDSLSNITDWGNQE